jgi:hypothetical protein
LGAIIGAFCEGEGKAFGGAWDVEGEGRVEAVFVGTFWAHLWTFLSWWAIFLGEDLFFLVFSSFSWALRSSYFALACSLACIRSRICASY